MKHVSFLLLIVFVISFSACEKDSTTTTSVPTNDYFISFELDGVPIELRSTQTNYAASGSNAYSASTIVDPSDFGHHATISFNNERDTLVGTDYLAMVGQTIQVGYCNGPGSNPCTTMARLEYFNDSTDVESWLPHNALPNYYIKVNSASYHSTIQVFGFGPRDMYLLEGEFILQMGDYWTNTTHKSATNGQFRLLFSEHS